MLSYVSGGVFLLSLDNRGDEGKGILPTFAGRLFAPAKPHQKELMILTKALYPKPQPK